MAAERIGADTAAAIVDLDTQALINKADDIVRSCTGTNCNTSVETRTAITQQLSALAQSQATATQQLLSIPSNSVLGRDVYEGYLNLGAAVAATYNYQCGNNTTNANCVLNSSTVLTAQKELENTLLEPAENGGINFLVFSFLIALVLLTFLLFFIFFIIGLFMSSKVVTNVPVTNATPTAPTVTNVANATPVTNVTPTAPTVTNVIPVVN